MRAGTRILTLFGVLATTVVGAAGAEETRVVVKGVHLCCGACERGVDEAVTQVEAADVQPDRETSTVTIVAPDLATVRLTLAALAEAGYHGTPDHPDLTIRDTSGAPEGQVERLTLTGFHNCCGACARSIEAAITQVEGVENARVAPRAKSCEVTGKFDARAVIAALHAAGFHARIADDAE